MWVPKTVIQQLMPPSMVIADELGEDKKQPSATPYAEQGNKIWAHPGMPS